MIKLSNDLISFNNLYLAWKEFRRGKQERPDVIQFERNLEDELFLLQAELEDDSYMHGPYSKFYIRDPKFRIVHKATARDRVVHQALFDALYPYFDKKFFFDSYSSRDNKGTHRAVVRVRRFVARQSANSRTPVFVLHADIDDFFASIDQDILLSLLTRYLYNGNYLNLCEKIIKSFQTLPGRGLPLGNLTSQLFTNIYLHELDHFIKQTLHVKYYIRYNDDLFVVFGDKNYLKKLSSSIATFLAEKLHLSLPEEKIKIKNLRQGVDVLGAVLFPYGAIPRKRNRQAILQTIEKNEQSGYTLNGWRRAVSYLGLLKHTKGFMLQEKLRSCSG